MFNTFKNKITNFASYLLGLDKQLADAKNDAERVRILKKIVEAQRNQLESVGDENEELKKQSKDNEETENIKLKQKEQENLVLNNRIKKLEEELSRVKKERDYLKTWKTDKEEEEQEASDLIREMDQSIDQTFAKVEIPPR